VKICMSSDAAFQVAASDSSMNTLRRSTANSIEDVLEVLMSKGGKECMKDVFSLSVLLQVLCMVHYRQQVSDERQFWDGFLALWGLSG
jgi:hypothetical protein